MKNFVRGLVFTICFGLLVCSSWLVLSPLSVTASMGTCSAECGGGITVTCNGSCTADDGLGCTGTEPGGVVVIKACPPRSGGGDVPVATGAQ